MTRHLVSLFLAPAMAWSMAADGANGAGDPLLFPQDKYTEETRTATTSSGATVVVGRSFKHIPYVAKPVDQDYQSLDVTVPVQVDGKAVDATRAPSI